MTELELLQSINESFVTIVDILTAIYFMQMVMFFVPYVKGIVARLRRRTR